MKEGGTVGGGLLMVFVGVKGGFTGFPGSPLVYARHFSRRENVGVISLHDDGESRIKYWLCDDCAVNMTR